MLRKYLLRLRHQRLAAVFNQKGQSLIIVTFAFLGLIAMLGLALDLGLVYIEQVRISRTADAAALAGVVELPFEEEAVSRAVEFIELNGYDVGEDTAVLVRGCIDIGGTLTNVSEAGVYALTDPLVITPTNMITGYLLHPAIEDPPRNIFVVDTMAYQPVNVGASSGDNCNATLPGTATKLRVSGLSNVNMNFMQFFGFPEVPVQDLAVGENVTNLDVAVVFDVSGSMLFETTCFDCWTKDSDKDGFDDIIDYPFPTNGTYHPLPDTTGGNLCNATPAPREQGVYKYFIHEAELYSTDVPLHGWEFEKRIAGQGFWVLQRVSGRDASGTDSRGAYIRPHPLTVYSQSSGSNYPQIQGATYNSECFDGPNLSYQCWETTANNLGEPLPLSNVPYVEYDFTPDWSGNTHIWIRAQGGGQYSYRWDGASPTSDPVVRSRAVYWQVGRHDTGAWSNVEGGDYTQLVNTANHKRPDSDSWRWVKLGNVSTTNGVQHTLRLYQGSAGFYVDKIIITNDPTGDTGVALDDDGDQYGGSSSVTTNFINLIKTNGGQGPDATQGSATREACNQCNPEFGLTIDPADCSCLNGAGSGCTSVLTTTNQLSNDLYHDEDPLRSAKEAVKNFAQRLDPKFDQLGVVAYSSNVYDGSTQRSELQCLQWATKNDSDGVRGCFDPSTDPISYTNVIKVLEPFNPSGSTNIPEAMAEGLEELGIDVPGNNVVNNECTSAVNDGRVCDRRGAARRVLILMTDGSPNRDNSCGVTLWNGSFGQGNPAYDCSIYYAREAANNNVTLYTIGIGSGVNFDLLTAMATGKDPTTGDIYFEARAGQYYPAAKPSDLDQIFDDILSNIFVRIVG